MPLPPEIVKCYKHIDLNAKVYIDELRELVEIPNISKDLAAEDELLKVIQWVSTRLKNLNFTIVLKQPDYEKYEGNRPLILIGTLENDPNKLTLLYYCHLDVLKVVKSNWETDPFKLIEKDGKMYGRGTAKMKGPLLCFLHAIQTYNELGIPMPINIKIICESMYECKSRGLSSVLEELKATFLVNVDCILMTESHWVGRDYPCIVYGMRGVTYFNLTVTGPRKDLSSGDFGGIVHEPMHDLLYILSSMVDPYGDVKIPSFNEDVVEVTPDEEEFYKKIKINVDEYRSNVGVNKLWHRENLKLVLMHVWRYPWFNLHFINSSCENSNAMDIPRKVICRFSIRTVPNQKYTKTSSIIINYVKKLSEELKTPNKVHINAEHPIDPWSENHQHWNYQAANAATKQVYKEEANYIREGNGFPILLKLRDAIPKRNILMLPIVNCEAGPHTDYENISVRCYIEGTKLLASYFYELNNAWRINAKVKANKSHQHICRNRL